MLLLLTRIKNNLAILASICMIARCPGEGYERGKSAYEIIKALTGTNRNKCHLSFPYEAIDQRWGTWKRDRDRPILRSYNSTNGRTAAMETYPDTNRNKLTSTNEMHVAFANVFRESCKPSLPTLSQESQSKANLQISRRAACSIIPISNLWEPLRF